jgi:nicotinamide mononucleotide transporter
VPSLCAWLVANGSSCLELVAVLFGIAGVYLSIRESIWNWPVGMINVALYAILFLDQRLYANAALQVVYFALSGYGWYVWKFGGTSGGTLLVTWAPRRLRWRAALATIAVWIVLLVATRLFGGKMPVLDAGTTAVSLVAEWMLAKKFIDNWVLWIGVDAVYVGMLLSAHLYLTTVNYAIYFALAVYGYARWRHGVPARVA